MKRVYKLIITNENDYHEIDFNRKDAQHSVKHFMLTDKNGKEYTVSVDFKDSKCLLYSDSGLLFEGESGSTGKSITIRCGEKARILNDSADQVLFQCEVLISSVLNDNGEPLEFDFGFELHEDRVITISRDRQSTVILDDPSIGRDYLSLIYKDGNIYIRDFKAGYGLFVNGIKTDQMTVLNNYSFISFDGVQFYFKDGYLFTDCAYPVRLSVNWECISSKSRSNMVYPKYNRSTRMQVVLPDEPIDVLDPPPVPQKPKRNLLLTLMPSLAMLILIVVVRGFMSTTGGSFVIFSACMMGVGVLTSIFTFIDERRNYNKSLVERVDEYNSYIDKKRGEIESSREYEKKLREEIYHDLQRDVDSIHDFSSELFDRDNSDPDFLKIYLGKGAVPASREVSYKKREQIQAGDHLYELPEQLKAAYANIENAPVFSDFAQSNAIGFIGQDAQLYTLMKNVTLDICLRHYYRDVNLFYIVDNDFTDKVSWLRWLPHVKNEELQVRNIVCNNESKTELLEYLYVLMSERSQNKVKLPHIIVFVLKDIGIKTHPVSQFFKNSKDLGVTFVFFEHFADLLPEYCDEIILLNAGNNGVLRYRENITLSTEFTFGTVDDSIAEQVAQRLCPVYCEEISLEHQLRKTFSFFEMYGIDSITEIDLLNNWTISDATKSLAAPIGVNAKDDLVYLDIHESAHGPHGLVAGTTGSGKSEVLLSYILSMAMNYPPQEVSFFIIDFKGGGFVNKLVKCDFPHLIGTITNIDNSSIERSLLSINAEKQKRLRLFAQNDIERIDDYIKKYRNGELSVALPHLVIIVDEFAELKAAQPEFMKELISLARVGRSLGIHLILATQKPSGQVSEEIWSNSRFKICLKVQDQRDSNEVLKSPLAAEIREPGRAYLQVGNNEILELFQSGYSGAQAETGEGSNHEFVINELSLFGKKRMVFQSERRTDEEKEQTQSFQLLNYLTTYCNKEHIARPDSMCLPELPEILPYERMVPENENDISVCLGIYDDPENQVQKPIVLDVMSENAFIIGSAQYGKTNVLQTIIRGLAENYTPDDVNIYIVDFNSMILRNFEALPHVGGVVCMNEDEKLKNLFKLLNQEIKRRKNILLDAGTSSFAAYRKAGYRDLPQIVLLIDNLTNLKETYFVETDLLLPICREGISVGISIVVTNSQMTGISYRYLANFSSRIALFCNDSNDYVSLMEYCRVRPKDSPGNVIILKGKRKYNGKIYLAFDGDNERDLIGRLKEFINKTSVQYVHQCAKPIPMIPKVLLSNEIKNTYKNFIENSSLFLGLDYGTVSPVTCDLRDLGLLGISGRPKMGKTNFMLNIVDKCIDMKSDVSIYIVDDFRKKLSIFKEKENVYRYTQDVSESAFIIKEVEKKLLECQKNENRSENLIVLLFSHPDALTIINSDKDALTAYKNIATKYMMNACMIFCNIENAYSSLESVKFLKDNKHLLYFDSIDDLKLADLSFSTKKAHRNNLDIGDAFYIRGEQCTRIKTAKYMR